MPAQRITVRKIREILRLHLESGLSIRQISASTKTSTGAIQKLLKQARELNLTWPLSTDLDDAQLANKFYPKAVTTSSTRFVVPDWTEVHQELKRKAMTKLLLWEEYCQRHPTTCYSYSQYCELYMQWNKRQRRSLRQLHKAGEKAFIDYTGITIPIVNQHTGEILFNAEMFVAVLGASNYTYAEASRSQKSADWLQSHVRMFEYFGGVPEILVPDNLRSGVSQACRYDPQTNASYQQLAAHYGVAVVPARPYKPKDKAKAEVGVQIVERWIMMRLRHHTFFSLAELNYCIRGLLEELNTRAFKQLPGNRREAFESIDRPALKTLPAQPYRYVEIKTVKVNIDYHVQFNQHHYSVPHQYVGERLELHAGETLIQIYFKGNLIASHPRITGFGMSTTAVHMPTQHERHQKWTPARLLKWARDIGPSTQAWVQHQLDVKDHPEQAYRVCLGLLNLSRSYPTSRLDNACKIANKQSLFRLKQIKSILKSNRDQLPEQLEIPSTELPQDHENVRGPQHFH